MLETQKCHFTIVSMSSYPHFPTTLIIPISACYYLELHNAITSYSGVHIFTDESSIGCLANKWDWISAKAQYSDWLAGYGNSFPGAATVDGADKFRVACPERPGRRRIFSVGRKRSRGHRQLQFALCTLTAPSHTSQEP